MDPRPTWERDLDALVQPALVTDPPPDVQRSILAAVLQATAMPTATARPVAMAAAARPIPLLAYALLAAVLVAYAAAISWLNGFVGGAGWVSVLASQLLAVSELVVGRPAAGEPMSVVWLLVQRAPWIALLPLAWWLWERDQSAAPVS
jgi:hypothetical protein